jgi:glucoamylase
MSELISADQGLLPGLSLSDLLSSYVSFAQTCQDSDLNLLARGRYTIAGQLTNWSDQTDGPALRSLTLMQGYAQMTDDAKAQAKTVCSRDVGFLLGGDPPAYQVATTNQWEDTSGYSMFARSVQLRCFREIVTNNPFGLDAGAAHAAADWIAVELPSHWDDADGFYRSLLPPIDRHGNPAAQYDPSIDPILACIYGGGIPSTDPQLLATAGLVRDQWTDPTKTPYKINADDNGRDLGPLIGRYVGDGYDGDSLTDFDGHPWAVCTCSFAELYFALANEINAGKPVPTDAKAATFLSQIGIDDPAGTAPGDAVDKLKTAGDRMLNAVLFHSDHLSLSEQFDATTGYEKSVSNLTWSYAAYLSAVRVRGGQRHYPQLSP